jgi:Uncharacterized conserved protein, contains FHA domain
LSEDEYTIGRANKCSILISNNEVKESVLNTISKSHCTIIKVHATHDEVYLLDLSSNGTFINGEKVGKGKKRILKNNDQISLASPQFKGLYFLFYCTYYHISNISWHYDAQ